MDSSKKWRLPVSIIVLILVLIFVNYQAAKIYSAHNQGNYLAAISDKEELLKNTPSPKVILVGGSNVAFGFDSKIIGAKLGMPVVNTGLQGGIGIRFALNFVKPYIHEGDIVIVSPEYENILDQMTGGDVLAEMLMLYPKGFHSLSSLNEAWEFIRAFPTIHTNGIHLVLEDKVTNECKECIGNRIIYYRSAFDPKTGDITTNNTNINKFGQHELVLDYTVPNIRLNQNVAFFNQFNQFVASQNAAMYFVYPSIVDNFDEKTNKVLQKTSAILERNLNFPILGTLKESAFPNDLMFDTFYHLNNRGRTLRSSKIADDLCLADTKLNCN